MAVPVETGEVVNHACTNPASAEGRETGNQVSQASVGDDEG